MQTSPTPPFIVYNASAGSGKTHSLVKRFLYRLLSNNSPEHVKRLLAITFTNKAALEMKTRILSQLECFATSETLAKESPVFIDIAQQCAIPTRALHLSLIHI